jgi:YidC/Oxa1 family membrane protein insertase
MEVIGDFFRIFLINPLINLFVLFTTLTGNAGFAVILLTILIRLITFPFTLKQMHMSRLMVAITPRMQDIQKRFTDPRRRQEETMKLYREVGFNPLGCFSGMLIQLPILIALYQTFRISIGEAPESVIEVSGRLYNWDYLKSGFPLPAEFLWMHLGRPDPFILPLLVGVSTFIQTKMTTMPAMDERQRAQNSMMNMLMPLIFAWITITLPSGLGLYYVLSNVIGIVMQYLYVGGGPFNWRALVGLSQEPVLPRALELRQKQDADVKARIGRTTEEAPAKEQAQARSNGASAAARRRRRYASGRRRGRR